MNSQRPTAILVDDEATLLTYLSDQLATCWPELHILDTAQNGREALAKIGEQVPDVVFLDIKMPGMTGLDVARELSAQTQIVFVTAFDQYAVQAFDHAAVDYLLKPVDTTRLALTVTRLQARLASGQRTDTETLSALLAKISTGSESQPSYLQWLRVGVGEEVSMVAADEVVYLRSDHKYTSVFTATAEHVLRAPLAELEQQLDPASFWRIHRGMMVAVKEIKSARRDLRGRYTITLRSRDEAIRSSAAYRHLFAQM